MPALSISPAEAGAKLGAKVSVAHLLLVLKQEGDFDDHSMRGGHHGYSPPILGSPLWGRGDTCFTHPTCKAPAILLSLTCLCSQLKYWMAQGHAQSVNANFMTLNIISFKWTCVQKCISLNRKFNISIVSRKQVLLV